MTLDSIRMAAADRQRAATAQGARGREQRTQLRRAAPDAVAQSRAPVPYLFTRAVSDEKAPAGIVAVRGHASVTESPYEMWDAFGEYSEVVSRGAFTKTLSETPDVALLLNHGGMTLARTKSGTLELAEDDEGLSILANMDERNSVARDVSFALERGDLDEMSFAFMVVRGMWSPDYTEYRINEVSLNKGDVSIVNYGANPAAHAELRAAPAVSTARTMSAAEARFILAG